LAVCELSSDRPAGGSSCKRDPPARDLVGAGDDLGLVARFRVDEEEKHGVSSVAADAEQRLGRGASACGPRVGPWTRSPSAPKRGVEGNRGAAPPDPPGFP